MTNGVMFDQNSAGRIAESTRVVERRRHGKIGKGAARGTRATHVLFLLKESMPAAPDALTGVAVRGWILSPDIEQTRVVGDASDDDATYTPQRYVKGDRVEWIVNRSADNEADADTYGIAVRINGELTVVWIDCGPQ